MHINWTELSQELSCEHKGSSQLACQAISKILGEEVICEAIEYYISGGSGSELSRSVLWHINPRSGMEYCYKIYKEDSDMERKRSAVELLRAIADASVLEWLPDFLKDTDESIQFWGGGVLDQLTFKNLVRKEDCQDILQIMKTHNNPNVRDTYSEIMELFND